MNPKKKIKNSFKYLKNVPNKKKTIYQLEVVNFENDSYISRFYTTLTLLRKCINLYKDYSMAEIYKLKRDPIIPNRWDIISIDQIYFED